MKSKSLLETPGPTGCLGPRGCGGRYLWSHETRTSHSNTWCAVVQSATTMIHAHSSVSVGAGSVCLFFFPSRSRHLGRCGSAAAVGPRVAQRLDRFQSARLRGKDLEGRARRMGGAGAAAPSGHQSPGVVPISPPPPGDQSPAPARRPHFKVRLGPSWFHWRRGQPARPSHWLWRTKGPPRRLLR